MHDATQSAGIPLEWGCKTYTIVIGPVEQPDSATDYPHQHGYVSCPVSTAITKGQAKAILGSIGAYKEDMYLHELETNRQKYHAYCFKGENGTHTSAERAIKRAWDDIQDVEGVKVTPKRLKAKLAVQEGASFVARNKPVIETYLLTPELRSSGRDIDEEVDKESNMRAFMQVIVNYRAQITDMVSKNGIETTHQAYADSSRDDQVEAIVCTSLLPLLVNRARITDGIPGLWFHGLPQCGKSYLFSQVPNYKKVATDAVGVSRFRLEGDQSGLLIDDVDEGFLFKPENSKTLKAITLGEREVVKTMGDTQEIRAFVVCTSNGLPDYLNPYQPKEGDGPTAERSYAFNCNAWKRRFVSLYFDVPVETSSIFVDFEQTAINIVARRAFAIAYEAIESEKLKSLFEKYYNHLENTWTDEDKELYNTVLDNTPYADSE